MEYPWGIMEALNNIVSISQKQNLLDQVNRGRLGVRSQQIIYRLCSYETVLRKHAILSHNTQLGND